MEFDAQAALKLSQKNQLYLIIDLVKEACEYGRRFILFEDELSEDTKAKLIDRRFELEYLTESNSHKIKW